MPKISQHNSDIVPLLQGIHLFHYDIAPCAQRVRFVLAEKGLTRNPDTKFNDVSAATLVAAEGSWNSRIVSLIKKEQFTEAYSAIQPNLVIPALVHNGELYTESIDIIEYLDSVLAGERLVPSADDPRYEDFHYLTELGKKLHWSIRHVTYRWGGVGRLNAKEQDKVESLLKRGQDEENLAEFYRDFNQGKISQETYDEHLRAIGQGFDELTKRLKDGRLFLTGDSLTIADAIWAMKVIRLEEMAYPTRELHLEVSEWFARIAARPSYETLVGNYRVLRLVFKVKSWLEKKLGTGLYWAAKRVVS